MTTSFSSRALAIFATSCCLLAARPPPAPTRRSADLPQPYPGAYAPYAAPPYGYAAPAWGGSAPIPTERNSTGMMAGGIALVSVGSVGSIIGAALLAIGTERNDAPCVSGFCVATTNGG